MKGERRRNEERHQTGENDRADPEAFGSEGVGQPPPAANSEQGGEVKYVCGERRLNRRRISQQIEFADVLNNSGKRVGISQFDQERLIQPERTGADSGPERRLDQPSLTWVAAAPLKQF